MSAAGSRSPYKGLMPFEDDELDVLFFFGRDKERALIESNLMASRLTVLFGETGVGKSSVLRAGVLHHLRGLARDNLETGGEPELAVVLFDAWRDEDPLAALRTAVAEAVTRTLGGSISPPDDARPLDDVFRAWQDVLGGDLYVILDQTEEYFLYHGGEGGPGTFAGEFPAVVGSADLRVNFMLAIREDGLAKLDAFRGRIPNVLGNTLRLDHLDLTAAREAIVQPVAEYNRRFGDGEPVELEPELVDAVLEQVVAGKVDVGAPGSGAVSLASANGAVRIETAYLQLVMHRLWGEELSSGSRTLRVETLSRLGGAQQIVRDHVERALDELSAPEQDFAARMFDHLVTPSGSKIAHGLGDLATYAGAPEGALVPVLAKLGQDRILRSVAGNGSSGSQYEIFHDVLTRPVLAWKAGHETQRELELQRAEADTRHRRLLLLTALASFVVLVMTGVAVFALTQRREARSQARAAQASARAALASSRDARASDLAARSVAQLATDPQSSLVLALRSAQLRPGSENEDALRRALLATHERAILPSRGPVGSVDWSHDGSLLVTASKDGSVRLWSPDGTPVRTFELGEPATGASFSPDASLIVAAGANGTARLWRTHTGKRVADLHHGGAVTSASFSLVGDVVLTTSRDGTARTWTTTGRPLQVMRHEGPVLSGSISPDGRLLVTVSSPSGGGNGRARVFDLASGRPLYEPSEEGVATAAFSPDSQLLITGSVDRTATLRLASDGELVHLFKDMGIVKVALFSPESRLVLVAGPDGFIRLRAATYVGRRVNDLPAHSTGVTSLAFSRGGGFFATSSLDDTARVWELQTQRRRAVLRGDTGAVLQVAFSPDGHLVATASRDGTARVWDAGTVPDLRLLARAAGPLRAASYAPDGGEIVTAGDDGEARILTPAGGLVRALPHSSPVRSALFARDRTRVFTVDGDGTLRVWNPARGRVLRAVRHASAGRLSLGGDGKLLATPRPAGGISVRSARTLRELRVVGRGRRFTAAAISPDGQLVAGAGTGRFAWVWHLHGRPRVMPLRGHTAALTDIEFSPDSRFVVTASTDQDARIWNVATGKSAPPLRGLGTVFGASFSPDGRWVVTAGPRAAALWQRSTGTATYLYGHTRPLTSAHFAPDGKRIVTSSLDGTTRVYTCQVCDTVSDLVALARRRVAGLARPLSAADRQRFLPGAPRTP